MESRTRPATHRSFSLRSFVLVSLAIGFLAFGAGVWAAPHVRPDIQAAAPTPPADLGAAMAPFWQVWSIVEERYVFRSNVDRQQMVYGAIDGLIQTLDDEGHTRFLTPEEARREESAASGVFDGIGIEVSIANGRLTIVGTIEGSPAERAGLRAGDLILAIDGQDTSSLDMAHLTTLIRGQRGTPVVLRVYREGRIEPIEVSVVRAEIQAPMVTWAIVPGTKVAHVRISQFGRTVALELRRALRDARLAGAEALVVDVRNNPGGLLDQVVVATSEFLASGNVLLQEDREGKRRAYPVLGNGLALDLPLVVLANEGSASASEIFAGALQDAERAKVVGGRTVGTGTVLSPFRLDGGSMLLLGTGQWLTPEGRVIRKRGILPDVPVELSSPASLLTPRALRLLSPEAFAASADVQLRRAVAIAQAEGDGGSLRGRALSGYAR